MRMRSMQEAPCWATQTAYIENCKYKLYNFNRNLSKTFLRNVNAPWPILAQALGLI